MNKKILIIEDDEVTCMALSTWLRGHGFYVEFAADAVTATSIARHEQPDVILLDLGLPGGEGYDVIARLRKHPELASVPIIVLSGRNPESDALRALCAGAAAYFQKPADNDKLLAAIYATLTKTKTTQSIS